MTKWLVSIITIICLLVACTERIPPHGTSLQEMQATLRKAHASNRTIALQGTRPNLPTAVNTALLGSYSSSDLSTAMPPGNEKRFDLAAHNVAARTFFLGLVKGTPYSIVVSPDITGTITLDLKNVTVQQALDATRDAYGYDFRRTSYGFEVLANSLRTQIFSVNYLDMERSGHSETQVTSAQPAENPAATSSGGTTVLGSNGGNAPANSEIKTKSKSDFWKTLNQTLQLLVGQKEGRSVIVNPEAGTVVVRAYPKELRAINYYLNSIQNNMSRQVLIEAKILEVQLSRDFQAGIDWNILGFQQQSSNFINNSTNSRAQSNNILQWHFSLGHGDFDATVKALSTQGNVQTLSNPRISTVNNQKAVIKVGQDQYFVTNVSSLSVATAGADNTNQNINLTPFFSGIALDVTPQIDAQGNVILHVHPSISTVTQQNVTVTLGQSGQGGQGNYVLPTALSQVREADSVVRARNGQVIVIGGLMLNNTSERIGKTPFAGDVPFLGTLFRNTDQGSAKSELVILLKPSVTTNAMWTNEMADAAKDFDDLKQGFHFGDNPNYYGNLGESVFVGNNTCNGDYC